MKIILLQRRSILTALLMVATAPSMARANAKNSLAADATPSWWQYTVNVATHSDRLVGNRYPTNKDMVAERILQHAFDLARRSMNVTQHQATSGWINAEDAHRELFRHIAELKGDFNAVRDLLDDHMNNRDLDLGSESISLRYSRHLSRFQPRPGASNFAGCKDLVWIETEIAGDNASLRLPAQRKKTNYRVIAAPGVEGVPVRTFPEDKPLRLMVTEHSPKLSPKDFILKSTEYRVNPHHEDKTIYHMRYLRRLGRFHIAE